MPGSVAECFAYDGLDVGNQSVIGQSVDRTSELHSRVEPQKRRTLPYDFEDCCSQAWLPSSDSRSWKIEVRICRIVASTSLTTSPSRAETSGSLTIAAAL